MTCLYTILVIFLSILYLSIIISCKQKIIMFHISSHLGVNSKFLVYPCVVGGEWVGVVYIPMC